MRLKLKMPPRKKIKTEKKKNCENSENIQLSNQSVCTECLGGGESTPQQRDDQLQDNLCLTKFTFNALQETRD